MTLYSYNKSYPQPIPFRIRLSDGRTRTDPSSFTEEELTDAGYTAVPDKPTPNSVQVLEWDSVNMNWLLRDKTLEELQAEKISYWTGLKLNRIQFEFMVEKLGLRPIIDNAITAMPETTEEEINAKVMAKVLFNSGQEFYRLHPLFTQLAPLVGLTEEQLDQIWLDARKV